MKFEAIVKIPEPINRRRLETYILIAKDIEDVWKFMRKRNITCLEVKEYKGLKKPKPKILPIKKVS